MRQLIQSDLPILYPITQADIEKARLLHSLSAAYPNTDTEAEQDKEPGIFAYVETPLAKMTVLASQRARHHDTIANRGYETVKREFTVDELAQGAGINPIRFSRSLSNPNGWTHGIPYAYHLGNIEGPHGTALVNMVRRTINRKSHWVLNIGCGPLGFQQANIEDIGIEKIAYADKNQYYNALGPVKKYLEQFGQRWIERSYTVVDKNNTQALIAAFGRQSISAVIRTGVGLATKSEMEGLKAIMVADGELFVSNSLNNQPMEDFLNFVEEAFQDITVQIGFERYTITCKHPMID